ncbi:hypothetical protein [Sphingomonas sp. LaA6.9]|nr:hypothetical protein [Sphingomonas sp. LaA6.9]
MRRNWQKARARNAFQKMRRVDEDGMTGRAARDELRTFVPGR